MSNLTDTIAGLNMSDGDRSTLLSAVNATLLKLDTTTPILHKPLKPTPYGGKVDAIASLNFIENLEEYFTIVKLPQEEWVPHAVGYLGEARGWWRASKQSVKTTAWATFRSTFLQQFTPADSVNAARHRLNHLQQGHDPVLDYITKFNDLLRLIPELDAGQARFIFIEGLEHELSKQVRLARPSTLQDAIREATILYDILHHNEPTSKPSSDTSNSGPEPMDINGFFTKLNAFLTRNNKINNRNYRNFTNRQNPNNNRGTNVNRTTNPPRLDNAERERCMRLGLCLRCRQHGHISRDCPTYSINALDIDPPHDTNAPPNQQTILETAGKD